jgi:hypothetical protein
MLHLDNLPQCDPTNIAPEISPNYWGRTRSSLCPTLKHLAGSLLKTSASPFASNTGNLSFMRSFKGTALVSTCDTSTRLFSIERWTAICVREHSCREREGVVLGVSERGCSHRSAAEKAALGSEDFIIRDPDGNLVHFAQSIELPDA